MEVKQLKYFIVVAKNLHFGKAAKELGITQPPLSRQIQLLEKELKTVLIARQNKWQLSLTETGRVLLIEAENIVQQFSNMKKRIREVRYGESGHLVIGIISAVMGNTIFAETLEELKSRYPKVTIEIIESSTSQVIGELNAKNIDVALTRPIAREYKSDRFRYEFLYNDPLIVALPADHIFAKRKDFPVSILKNENFILVPVKDAESFHNYIFHFCKAQGGFYPRVGHEIVSFYSALQLTAAKLGITIVSESYSHNFNQRICYRKFTDYKAELPIIAVYSDYNTSVVLQNFLALLKERIKITTK